MDYNELVEFASNMPRVPKRELKCHPLVVMQLKAETWWLPQRRSKLWNYYDLYACPVFTDRTMEPGAWEFYEDGEVVARGNTESHDGDL